MSSDRRRARAGVIASNRTTTATTRSNLAVVTKYVLWVHRPTRYPLDDPTEVFLTTSSADSSSQNSETTIASTVGTPSSG